MVVHVVYNTRAENISTAQIKSQIAVLNKDFRATNSDKSKVPNIWKGLVTDVRVQFALATTDPTGKSTSGITRTENNTYLIWYRRHSKVISKRWSRSMAPSDRYLNLWVCTLGGGLLGYAQFPGGPLSRLAVSVILNTAFGTEGSATAPFNLGRTATHEIGHWLNLRHIWGTLRTAAAAILPLIRQTPRGQTMVNRPSAHLLQQRSERRHVHELYGLR